MSYNNKNVNDSEDFEEEEEDDEEEEEDDAPPEVDISQFKFGKSSSSSTNGEESLLSFGYNKGRSSPNQRKAMGRSSSSMATVYLCTNCGSEFVKWMGRCPTCKEWNTLQEHVVTRGVEDSTATPFFSTAAGRPPSSSWLDGIVASSNYRTGSTGTWNNNPASGPVPIRATDLYSSSNNKNNKNKNANSRRERIHIPGDDEFNTVLGGGIMPGSLILVGGDPGVGKSTLLLQTAGSLAELCTPTPQIGMGLGGTAAGASSSSYTSSSSSKMGPVWYCSGEESPEQIADRAERLGIQSNELWLISETHADSLCAQVVRHQQQYLQYTSRMASLQHDDDDKNKNNHDDDETEDDDDDETDAARRTAAQMSRLMVQLQPLPPSLLVIDSIQTMVCTAAGASSAGGITQVRECVAMFLRLAKSTGIPIFLVGHVTKSGDVAGPRTVEHMVDAVLYLEGMASTTAGSGTAERLRLLRASKNRFGSTHNVGVYEMTAGRLQPVSDPSSLFLSQRLLSDEDSQGCAVAIALEGMRAIAVEVQALVTSTGGGGGGGQKFGGGSSGMTSSKRNVNGIAYPRLMLLLGVLQKRCGVPFWNQDVYVNVAGRMQRLDASEKASDLALAVALVSSHVQIGVRADTAFVGEVGLLGELRPVPSMEQRLTEARRMGFSRVVSAPADAATTTSYNNRNRTNRSSSQNHKNYKNNQHGVEWIQCRKLDQAIQEGLVRPIPQRTKRHKRTPSNNNPDMDIPNPLPLQYDEDDFFEDDAERFSPSSSFQMPPPQQRQQPNIPSNQQQKTRGTSSSPQQKYDGSNINTYKYPGRLSDLGLDEVMPDDDGNDDDDDREFQ